MKSIKARVILCLRVTLLLRKYLKTIFDIFVFVFLFCCFRQLTMQDCLIDCKTFLKLKATELDFVFGPISEVFAVYQF